MLLLLLCVEYYPLTVGKYFNSCKLLFLARALIFHRRCRRISSIEIHHRIMGDYFISSSSYFCWIVGVVSVQLIVDDDTDRIATRIIADDCVS